MVDISGSIKNKDQHGLDKRLLQIDFLLLRRIYSTPFHALSFHFRIELETPTFITSHNYLQHAMILVNKLDETAKTFNPLLSLFNRSVAQISNISSFYPYLFP
jgi:hypothetical protein